MMFGGKQVVVCGYGEVNSWAPVSLSILIRRALEKHWRKETIYKH